MSLLKTIKNLISINWSEILSQYSAGALVIEILIVPFWFYCTGFTYFNLKRLLACDSLVCYKISLLFSLLPSSAISAMLSGISRTYLFKESYNIKPALVDPTMSKTIWINQRTLLVGLFALTATSVVVTYKRRKTRSNSAFSYKIRTFKPRMKNKIRVMRGKMKNRIQRIRGLLTKNRK